MSLCLSSVLDAPLVNAVVAFLGVLVFSEGVALVCNWRGCAEEFSSRLQADTTSQLWFVKPWLVRGVIGPGIAGMGGMVIADAIRYL